MCQILHDHCVNHHWKMIKLITLVLLFVALVPGVLLNIKLGSSNKFVPIFIHGTIFAVVYSVMSHMYWSHMKHKHMKMMRHINKAVNEEVQIEQLANIQLNQMMHAEMMNNLSSKCDGRKD